MTSKTTTDTSSNDTLETVVYEYNLQNRMSKVTTTPYVDNVAQTPEVVEYAYNTDGIRVQKTVDDTQQTDYLIDPANHTGYAQVLEEWTSDITTPANPVLDEAITYTIGDDVISQSSSISGVKHFLYDGHGSTRQLARPDNTVIDSYSYDGYGVMLGDSATPKPAQSAVTSLLYAGEQFDTNAQQYYFRARYYNPANGLFNRMDPYAGNMQDPQSLHKYLYCHNNPVNYIDPTGEFSIPEKITALAITSFMFNVGITAVTCYNTAKDVGTIDGVVINFGVSAGGKGFAGSLIFSLVWYWKTNTFSLLGTFEFGIAPTTAFKKTSIWSIVATAGIIVNSNSASELEGFGVTATWPKALMKHIIPKKYSGVYSTMMFLANHANKKPLPLQGVYKKKPGVFQLTQSSSGAVMMTAGVWDFSFGTTVGLSKVLKEWDLEDYSMPDTLKDIIERVKPKMRAITKDSTNEQWGGLLDDI